MEGHGSKPPIRNDIQIPPGWVCVTRELRNGQLTTTCGGCNTPNYCSAKGKCHRGVTFGYVNQHG